MGGRGQVGLVQLPPLFLPGSIVSGKSLSLEMLRSGWSTTYEQAGAEYGKWGKDEFLRVEAEAKYVIAPPPTLLLHLICL